MRYSELINTYEKSLDKRENLSETTLSLINTMIKLLPEVRKRKLDKVNRDGMLGIWLICQIVFIIREGFSLQELIGISTIAICILLGIWLYLRHREMRRYKQEVLRFEDLCRKFEQEKEDFIKSL